MSQSKYESKICSIPADAHTVYQVLSNIKSLERVRHLIPEDKVQELDIQEDVIRIKVNGLGQKIGIKIVDRQEDRMLKFGVENSPVELNFWIQLKQISYSDTRVRLTLHADIPMMFKLMLDKKLQIGIDEAAEMLTRFPYEDWLKIDSSNIV